MYQGIGMDVSVLFLVNVGLGQGFVMPSESCNVYMDGVVTESKDAWKSTGTPDCQ